MTPAADPAAGLRESCLTACSAVSGQRNSPGRPPEKGGCLACAARRRPSSIHAGIASTPAPALRHRPAAHRAGDSSSSPSDVPSRIPATSASRSARPAVSSPSAATAAASSPLLISRHFARCRASPQIAATSIRSACGRLSCIRSSMPHHARAATSLRPPARRKDRSGALWGCAPARPKARCVLHRPGQGRVPSLPGPALANQISLGKAQPGP
jgi:hypothetical protein